MAPSFATVAVTTPGRSIPASSILPAYSPRERGRGVHDVSHAALPDFSLRSPEGHISEVQENG
jgi:hypothetical protein